MDLSESILHKSQNNVNSLTAIAETAQRCSNRLAFHLLMAVDRERERREMAEWARRQGGDD